MTRSKQQALFFLLGAVIVGGALGFSADRVFSDNKQKSWAPRQRMYDDLAMTEGQRQKADSVLDSQNCDIAAVMKPVRPILDSIRSAGRQQFASILNPDQVARLELRRAEMARRDSLEKARRDSIAATRKTLPTCRN